MKIRKRGLLVLLVVALATLGVAVPVVAHAVSTPGMDGRLNFVNVDQYADPDHAVRPDPRGPSASMYFSASVLVTGSPDAPNERVHYTFTARKLCPNTAYTLVNFYSLHGNPTPPPYTLNVNALGAGTTTRHGMLWIRSTATLGIGANKLAQFQGDPWASGARFELVRSSDVHTDGAITYIHESDAVLFSVLGIPLVFPEHWGAD
jgi:hypothetical protein